MLYLLDTNILIRSKNEMPMDIWLTFWTRMQEMMAAGQVFSSVKVKDEIERGADELTSWMRNHAPKGFYLPLDGEVMHQYANAQAWVQSNPVYKDTAKLDFANVVDAYLVATAAAKGMTKKKRLFHEYSPFFPFLFSNHSIANVIVCSSPEY